MSKRVLFLLALLIPLVSIGQLDVKPNYTKPYFQGSVEVSDTVLIDNIIQLKDGATIGAENGGGSFELRANGIDGAVQSLGTSIYQQAGTFGVTGVSFENINTLSAGFGVFAQNFSKNGQMLVFNNDAAPFSTTAVPTYPTAFSAQGWTVNAGVFNVSVISGSNGIAKTSNTAYTNQIGFNTGGSFETRLSHTLANCKQ